MLCLFTSHHLQGPGAYRGGPTTGRNAYDSTVFCLLYLARAHAAVL